MATRIIYTKDDLLALRTNNQIKVDQVFITSKDVKTFDNTKYATFQNKVVMNDEVVLNKLKTYLIKLSDNNYEKLYAEIMNIHFTDASVPRVVDTIYRYAIECIFYVHIYVGLLMKYQEKNSKVFTKFIEHILNVFKNPIKYESADEENKSKRYELGTVVIINHLYKNGYFTKDFIKTNVLDYVFQMNRSNDFELILKWFEMTPIAEFEEYLPLLTEFSNDKKYPTRLRFSLQQVLATHSSKESD